MLYYSALLFWTITLHAAHVHDLLAVALFSLLTPISVLTHGKYHDQFPGKSLIYALDVVLASGIPLYGIINTKPDNSLAYCAFIYAATFNAYAYSCHIFKKHDRKALVFHILMHIHMVIAGHAYLIQNHW